MGRKGGMEALWNKSRDQVKLKPVKDRLRCLMDQMSAQHLSESCHLTPTERLNRNYSSMVIYHEKILGMPPLDLPETLWKRPDVNLIFQTFQVLSQKDRNTLSARITLCRTTGPLAVCQSSLFVENTFHNEIQLLPNILKMGKCKTERKLPFHSTSKKHSVWYLQEPCPQCSNISK